MPARKDFAFKKEEAILALMTQPTIRDAARAAAVGEKTLRNWLREPAFHAAYYQARSERLQHAWGHVAEYLTEGVDVLRDVMRDRDASATARVGAVRSLFEFAMKDAELSQVQERIAKLEAALERIQGHAS